MLWQKLMQKPVLAVGILMFIIFLMQPTTKQALEKYRFSRVPHICNSIVDRVSPKAPTNWKFECQSSESMVIKIQLEGTHAIDNKLKQQMYKILANAYVQLAGWSNLESLEILPQLTIVAETSNFIIISKTDGQSAASFAGLTKQDEIIQKLAAFVRTKEIPKR